MRFKLKKFANIQIIFIGSMVAFDFAFGIIFKNILSPTGIFDLVRIDMVIPVMLMMVTRLMLDRIGTLIIYETAWGVLAVVVLPNAYGLPGLLKIIPAISQGITYDIVMSGMRNMRTGRVYAAAISGGLVSWIVIILMKVGLGIPWVKVTKIVFSFQIVTGILISVAGAYLGILLWERVKDLHLAKRIKCADQLK